MNVGDHFEALTASFSKLVGLHIKLARVEAVEDVKALGRPAVVVLALLPLALGAFALLTCAVLVALTRVWPLDAALAVVGGVYLALTLVGLALVKKSLAQVSAPMNDSANEVANTLAVVSHG